MVLYHSLDHTPRVNISHEEQTKMHTVLSSFQTIRSFNPLIHRSILSSFYRVQVLPTRGTQFLTGMVTVRPRLSDFFHDLQVYMAYYTQLPFQPLPPFYEIGCYNVMVAMQIKIQRPVLQSSVLCNMQEKETQKWCC